MAVSNKTKTVANATPKALNPIRLQFASAALGGLIAKGSTLDYATVVKLAFQYADTAMEALGE